MDIERIRFQYRGKIEDRDIAWGIQVYQSRAQLEWCMPQIREHYPTSRVIIINDGDADSYEDITDKYQCRYIHGEHLMKLPTCHLYIERLLIALLNGSEKYLFRIDPDTKVSRRFRVLPGFSSVFGTIETLSEHYSDEITTPANIQGGCIGFTRDAAEEILNSKILNYQTCATAAMSTWARCADMRSVVNRGEFADDHVISWAAFQLGIPIVESSEIRSRWRRTVRNQDLRFAVTHPHKLSQMPTGRNSMR